MKKVVVIAIAAALASPMGLAANTPDNVGNVTYLGNIVANSPMWQWTVNDYPGGRLDAKPTNATTANGVTTYPLNGQSFIAVSGYLPSMTGFKHGSFGSASATGTVDKTSLTDGTGSGPGNITSVGKGAVTFTLAATGKTAGGSPVEGKLLLQATELRGARGAQTINGRRGKYLQIVGGSTPFLADTTPGSCYVGTGAYSSSTAVIGGTSTAPTSGEMSPTSFAAFIQALNTADSSGNAPKFQTIPTDTDIVAGYNANCNTPTSNTAITSTDDTSLWQYLAAAHVLEVTPKSLSFPQAISGVWEATMTVTAYQM